MSFSSFHPSLFRSPICISEPLFLYCILPSCLFYFFFPP
jgi:hypothetical protein